MSGTFDFDIIFQSIPFLAKGMWLTLMLTAFGMIGGLLLGTLLALCRLSPFRLLSFAGGSYVNFFRSMPLILVIFWFYFLVPLIVGQPVGVFTPSSLPSCCLKQPTTARLCVPESRA